MRYAPLLLVIVFAAACGGPTSTEDPVPTADTVAVDPLENYRQLVGEWIDSTSSPDYTCFERWSLEGDSAIDGFGHVIAKGDTVFIEDLRLSVVNGNVVYSARVGSQNNGAWVPFTAEGTGPDTLRFENALHDFPQCITYVKDSAGGWDVAVTGTERGEEHSEHFRFRKR